MAQSTNLRVCVFRKSVQDRLKESESPGLFDNVTIHIFEDGTAIFILNRQHSSREDRFTHLGDLLSWYQGNNVPALLPGEILCFVECFRQLRELGGCTDSDVQQSKFRGE